jgi:amino acid adenylation domain-containing protein
MAGLLQHWVAEQAQRRPAATAVVLGSERLTYGELEAQSTRLARLLGAVGCERGDRVCLLLPKSPSAIVAIVGALKADCIYVPIDLTSPAPRVARMLASCEPRCLLIAGAAMPLLEKLQQEDGWPDAISVGWMEAGHSPPDHLTIAFTSRDLASGPSAPWPSRNTPQDPAYILFTSGSTGQPKGVVITHGNVMAFVGWALKYFDLRPTDRLSGHPPLHFDLSVFDIFGALAAGAELHLVPESLKLEAAKLAAFIRASALTQWFSVPSVLVYMAHFDAVRPHDFPALKRLLWCGDVLPTPVLRYWMERLPHVAFTNLYGPTEATIASSYYTVPACPDDAAAIPIGTACDGEELLVLDEQLRPVPPGTVGHLYIRGVGLSPGYWRDAAKTRAAFLAHPDSGDPADRLYKTGDLARVGADGLIYFVGRADSQIKSRGYRIELGEIETALHTVKTLRDGAVVAVSTAGFEGAAICCAYVPVPGAAVTPASLRRELAKLLPAYMLPSRWRAFERLPVNANGKVDRAALKELFRTHETAPLR